MGILDEKSILVTGGGSGIGASTAEILAREGAKVAVSDVNENAGEDVVRLIEANGGEATFIHCDVSQESDVENMIAEVVGTLGGLDSAFNNAGITGPIAAPADISLEAWNQVIAINLTGVWLCMKYEIRHLLKGNGGSIVNTASTSGLVGSLMSAAYSASKHGVIGLTRSAAKKHGMDGIRVNAVCPGLIETPLAMDTPFFQDPAVMERATSQNAMHRFGQPAEVGELTAWLLSDAASFVTGTAIPVDAAFTA